jgi:hypothetical protein
MDGGLTIGQLTQIGAWGLGVGSVFFSTMGIRADKDYFLCLGLVACILADFGFAVFLADQGAAGEDAYDGEGGSGALGMFGIVKSNETIVTIYVLLALLSVYGLACQLDMYREEGCGFDEDDEEEEETQAADPRLAPLPPVPAPASSDSAAKKKTKLSGPERKALRDSNTGRSGDDGEESADNEGLRQRITHTDTE